MDPSYSQYEAQTNTRIWLARLDPSGKYQHLNFVDPIVLNNERRDANYIRQLRREFVSKVLSELEPNARTVYPRVGKPFVEGAQLYFSATSRRDFLLIATSRQLDVGVDLEIVDTNFDYRSLLDQLLEPANVVDVHSFFQEWTRTEAVAKCLGVGLSGIEEGLDATGCEVQALDLPAPLVGAIAIQH